MPQAAALPQWRRRAETGGLPMQRWLGKAGPHLAQTLPHRPGPRRPSGLPASRLGSLVPSTWRTLRLRPQLPTPTPPPWRRTVRANRSACVCGHLSHTGTERHAWKPGPRPLTVAAGGVGALNGTARWILVTPPLRIPLEYAPPQLGKPQATQQGPELGSDADSAGDLPQAPNPHRPTSMCGYSQIPKGK